MAGSKEIEKNNNNNKITTKVQRQNYQGKGSGGYWQVEIPCPRMSSTISAKH